MAYGKTRWLGYVMRKMHKHSLTATQVQNWQNVISDMWKHGIQTALMWKGLYSEKQQWNLASVVNH